MTYQTLTVTYQPKICYITFNRPDHKNALNNQMVKELKQVLDECNKTVSVVVLQGNENHFCTGADFEAMQITEEQSSDSWNNADLYFEVCAMLSSKSFVSVAHVRGEAMAGGIGLIAACDIVVANSTASFALSELLFGLFPACVMPFLIRKIGYQKTNFMTLMTRSFSAGEVAQWGLVDLCGENSMELLRTVILRLRFLSKEAIQRYNDYKTSLDGTLKDSKQLALHANRTNFLNQDILNGIKRFIETGHPPVNN